MDMVNTAFSIDVLTSQPEIRSGFIVLIFISFDILFGLVQAIANQNFKSSIMRQGLFHKLGEILAYAFGVMCDSALPLVDIMVPFSLAGAITIYVVVMEIGSILENISKLSPELAKYLGFVFEKLRPPEDLPDPGKEEEEDMKK